MYYFKFADIGEGLHEGKILSLNITQNQKITESDVMFLVETDKVNTEITAPISGIVHKIHFNEGDVIKVGDIVVEINENNQAELDTEVSVLTSSSVPEDTSTGIVGNIETSMTTLSSFQEEDAKSLKQEENILISPLARKIAQELNIDINNIKGTGPNNRILLRDVENWKQPKMQEKLINNITDIEIEKISNIRKVIAKNMKLAKDTIPEATVFRKIDVTNLVKLRSELKAEFAKKDLKLSYLPFLIKAIGLSLVNFSKLNCSYDEDKEEITYKKFYNIGVAIDTERGLVVPTIKDVNKKSLLTITKELNILIDKALNNKLLLADMQNSSFTVTNYGSVGIEYGTPIIKYPEVAILGMGVIDKKFVINHDGSFLTKDFLPISMTIDHRVIDGADVGRFLKHLNNLLLSPNLLLIEG